MLLRIFLLLLLSLSAWSEPPKTLDRILQRGEIRIGTTGDYPPFSLLQKGRYQGFDIRLAQLAAERLGVRTRFIKTQWSTLLGDLKADRFDIAVGGISRTLTRAAQAALTQPTFITGKCPLVRRGDEARFSRLELVDRAGVRVAVNPGGTNQSYARSHLHRATLVLIADNLSIPDRIARGDVDLMITDRVEALRATRRDPRLALASAPWTVETMGFLLPREQQSLLNWFNLFLEEMQSDGTVPRLRQEFELDD